MKTETQIAKENVKKATTGRAKFWHKAIAEEHKQSCEREKKFLEEYSKGIKNYLLNLNGKLGGLIVSRNINLDKEAKFYHKVKRSMENRLKDLQGAIKEYNDGGVR